MGIANKKTLTSSCLSLKVCDILNFNLFRDFKWRYITMKRKKLITLTCNITSITWLCSTGINLYRIKKTHKTFHSISSKNKNFNNTVFYIHIHIQVNIHILHYYYYFHYFHNIYNQQVKHKQLNLIYLRQWHQQEK